MLFVLFVLLAAAGFAQTGQDARPLLRDIAEASRNLTTYSAEGTIAQDLDAGMAGGKLDLTFHVATRSPEFMRVEMTGGPDWMTGLPYTAVCNGRAGWVYIDKVKRYEKISAAKLTEGYCTPGTLTSFAHVADDVISAVITGTGHAQFGGRSQPCVQVRARYRVIKDLMIPPGMVGKVGRVDRRMCIDRTRKLILWDQLEADLDAGPDRSHILETVTYNRIELNPDLPATMFDFQPPEGATLFKEPEPPTQKAAPADATARALHVHNPPSAIAKVEPEYSQEAWDEGIQGTVILLPEIDVDGSIGEIKIRQPLGYGLDERAIECVRKWKFNPATDDGQPVKGTAWVEMYFSLPDQRPERPSIGPVSRPVPPPRLPTVELLPPTDLDEFFYLVALNFKEPAACQKIYPMAAGGGGGFSRRGYQVQDLRSECYLDLASILHDAELCGHVKPVKTEGLDGSKFDKADCLTQLNGPTTIAVPDPHRMEPFIALLRKLGYDDQRIAEFRYRQTPQRNPIQAAYSQLLTEPAFMDRVRAAPGYAEARSRAKVRTAHASEFLFQMVAIDTGDASLCAMVSPNATFVYLPGRTALLRSQCYRSLAYDTLDAALCDELPALGSFPFADREFESRENCHRTVAIYRSKNFKKGSGAMGAASFAHPADFETAMQEIGYSAANARVEKPAPHDYWDFLSNLALRGRVEERKEFVRRVMTLK